MPLHSTHGTVRAEGSFGHLRYLSGGHRPSETARQALSLRPFPTVRLVLQHTKGGISLAAPPELASRLHSLPPMLHMVCQNTTPSCSKGPRGLSVLPRVPRIFARTTTSPSPPLRHRPSRYTIRAGRNLPDKEFRYLRTVIVTAAVYRGFGSGLAPLPLTFRHRAGVRPHTSSCEFAESCVFSKQSPGPGHCDPFPLLTARAFTYSGRPISRSYGAKLPSSLAGDHSRA